MSTVIFDDQGNLYGTASKGGNNVGIVYELQPGGNHWKPSMLYNFCSRNNCIDGITPQTALTRDANGILYGTTLAGGKACSECGLVFKLEHTKYGWLETVLHAFAGGPDGSNPAGSLILDTQGNLYGATTYGNAHQGNSGYGTVFEITP